MARYITRLMLIFGVVALLYGCKTATIPIPEAKPIAQVEYQMLVIGEDQAHPIVVPIPAHLPDYRSMAINVLPAPCGEFSERGFFFFRFHMLEDDCSGFLLAVAFRGQGEKPEGYALIEFEGCKPVQQWVYKDGKPVIATRQAVERSLDLFCKSKEVSRFE